MKAFISIVGISILTTGLAPASVHAQQSVTSARPVANPVRPSREFSEAVTSGTRSETGAPGSRYWQQWTNYTLRATVDPDGHRIGGTARIEYFNNSPDTLDAVHLHLHQNLHAPGVVRNQPAEITGGVNIGRIVVDRLPLQAGLNYDVRGTLLTIRPLRPVAPSASITFTIDWSFLVPQNGVGRMGWSRDDLLFAAYWYPQMAVYDDVGGWHVDPYLGNAEFYAGFGRYDVELQAPVGWLVAGTGTLTNQGEVFPREILNRIARAESSDVVVNIVTQAEINANTVTTAGEAGHVTWRFHADSVRDVSFSITRASLWDATRTPVGDRDRDGRTDYTRIDAIYRSTAPKWTRMARYAQHSIDFLSRWTGLPYPWPHMTAVEGAEIITGGMEFPMMTLIGDYNENTDSALYYVAAHELAHMWVPMIVGVDERRRAWMDEGTTTFNENQARKEFFPGVDHDEPDREAYLALARLGGEGEMMRWTDYHYDGAARGVASYSKPATVLAALRGMLGEDLFLRAYRGFLADWAYRHPQPWDFFNAFEHVVGQDLDWFWRSWYYETWTLDQSISLVEDTPDGLRILVEDLGTAPMPVIIAISVNGHTVRETIPVDAFLNGERTVEIIVQLPGPAARVEIDPDHLFPDIDRSNNAWHRPLGPDWWNYGQ